MSFNKYLIGNVDLLVLKLGIEDVFLCSKVSSDYKCYRSCSSEFKRYGSRLFDSRKIFIEQRGGVLKVMDI